MKASSTFVTQVLGLSVEEALTFWRRSFSGHTDDQFNKRYKYNIRHSYGLEGRRANYPAKRYTFLRSAESADANLWSAASKF